MAQQMNPQELLNAKLKGEKVFPGLYFLDGQMYADGDEMCRHYELPITPENLAFLAEECAKMCAELAPEAEFLVQPIAKDSGN